MKADLTRKVKQFLASNSAVVFEWYLNEHCITRGRFLDLDEVLEALGLQDIIDVRMLAKKLSEDHDIDVDTRNDVNFQKYIVVPVNKKDIKERTEEAKKLITSILLIIEDITRDSRECLEWLEKEKTFEIDTDNNK